MKRIVLMGTTLWALLFPTLTLNAEEKAAESSASALTNTPAQTPEGAPALGAKPGETMTVDLGGGVKLNMVWIPPGEFIMGSPIGEKGRDVGEVQHRVRLTKGFWLGKYEVTQAQWDRLMTNNPSRFKGTNMPVDQVTWDECQEFLKKLDALIQNSKSKIQNGRFRLPTEAEWEYACRAGTTNRYSFGDDEEKFCEYGNYCDASNTDNKPWRDNTHRDGYDKTAPAGAFKPNAWGLYDMHGNVQEWCQDYWYGGYDSKDATNPTGSSLGSYRIVRGGTWWGYPEYCRSACRWSIYPTYRSLIGFRVVCSSMHRHEATQDQP
ncbi:MAG: formylglycine-generating enzyme family protein [Lentisphaerae bacterium]|nr:formylglycine-generating enzyme family protein [Lentisphaerota bacterium]